ncbi:MAG TPA: TIGR00730 family Rossman fold protein [Candidatus Sulfotelmatobacter sp.]|jgi:uncharacterized protein (TIGR00730 family)|nr:TIGR00730 family Rossman fold protein [Candidatus Sulfotelmatobacter sp.]
MKSLCVFCGSSAGRNEAYVKAAANVGRLLAERGITLIYGGGSLGLMGACAEACLGAGGKVVGVIPKHLMRMDVGHLDLTALHVVDSMHERKAMMAELSNGFIVLPGGIGTMEEFFEIWTWGQLGIHRKPFGVLNVNGYYDALFLFITTMVEQGFLKSAQATMTQLSEDPVMLLDALAAYVPPENPALLKLSET